MIGQQIEVDGRDSAGLAQRDRAAPTLAAAYLDASRWPAIYFNLTFAILLLVVAPVRYFAFGLPFFPSGFSMALEWGVIVPACLATAYLHWARVSIPHLEHLLSFLIAMSFAALMWDVTIWQSFGIPIPHEYSGLFFIAALSVAGLSARLSSLLSVLFIPLSVATVLAPGDWEPRLGGFHIYFDLVAVGFALLNVRSLRNEAGISWQLNEQLSANVRLTAQRAAHELEIQKQHEAALQASETRFRTVVESAPTAMVMIDGGDRIALVNSEAEKLFDYPRESMLGLKIEMLLPDGAYRHDATSQSSGMALVTSGIRSDGSTIAVEIEFSPIRTSDGDFQIAAIADVTERNQAQRALNDLNQSLAAQIDENRIAFSRLKETQNQLVQAEKMASLGGLVAGVAHEINTPIGVGVTAASYLQDEMQKLGKAFIENKLTRSQLQGFVNGAENASRMVLTNLLRASDLIRSFKQVAVDQTTDDRRTIDLRDYMDEILTSLRPQLRAKSHVIELSCDPALKVELVPGALAQILTNLVMNALTHAFGDRQNGSIHIAVEKIEADLLLRFGDNGKGIPADVLPKIFDPFFTTQRGAGGTGLGLHIVFNLVHQSLGGTIQVSSLPGQGTDFFIRFPA